MYLHTYLITGEEIKTISIHWTQLAVKFLIVDFLTNRRNECQSFELLAKVWLLCMHFWLCFDRSFHKLFTQTLQSADWKSVCLHLKSNRAYKSANACPCTVQWSNFMFGMWMVLTAFFTQFELSDMQPKNHSAHSFLGVREAVISCHSYLCLSALKEALKTPLNTMFLCTRKTFKKLYYRQFLYISWDSN